MRMLAVSFTLSIVLLALFAAGCHYSTAHFSDVAMSRTAGDKHEPGRRVTSFQKSDAEMHCCAFVANTPEGTEVKAVWKQKGEQGNSVLDSAEIVIDGDSWVDFFLRKPPADCFAYGSYAVELFINGVMKQTMSFTVAPQFTGGPVREALLAEAVDEHYFPVEQASAFPVNVKKVYATVYIVQDGGSSVVTARWYRRGTDGDEELVRTDFPVEGAFAQWVGFKIEPSVVLPAGEYVADILQNGNPVTSLPFTLR